MTTGTQVTVPQGIQLPAHLQGPDAAAAIAAANAAAAGGIKSGSFPRISIKGGKFHEKDGGETKTYFMPAAPGQPPLPMMCLEAVIVAANPALTKLYYKDPFAEGEDREPNCSSSNGVTPDSHITAPQNSVCATCPQNAWGSKVSKMSGKDIKACDDNKQLAVLPAMDLTYKALGLTITKAALTDWGKYVRALSDRGFPVDSIVTNLTFDATASFPKLQFAYNRFLTAEEYAKVKERQQGDDVKLIVSQSSRMVALPQLPPPTNAAAPAAQPAAATPPAGAPQTPAAAATPSGPQFPPETTGFGATPQPAATQPVQEMSIAPSQEGHAGGAAPAAAPQPEQKRKRRTRAEMEADAKGAQQIANDPLAHLAPDIKATVLAVGAGSVAGKAILAQFPAPVVSPLSGLDDATKATIAAVGGADSVAGKAILTALSNRVRIDGIGDAQPKAAATTAAPAEGDKPQPSGVVPPSAAAPTPPATGFGAAPAPQAPASQPAPATSVSAENLRALLAKKLGIAP